MGRLSGANALDLNHSTAPCLLLATLLICPTPTLARSDSNDLESLGEVELIEQLLFEGAVAESTWILSDTRDYYDETVEEIVRRQSIGAVELLIERLNDDRPVVSEQNDRPVTYGQEARVLLKHKVRFTLDLMLAPEDYEKIVGDESRSEVDLLAAREYLDRNRAGIEKRLEMKIARRASQGVLSLAGIDRLPSKGRAQESDSAAVREIVASGRSGLSFLLEKLPSEHPLLAPILDFWPTMTEGDAAFVLLSDFFLGPNGETSLPQLCWDALLREEDDASASANEVLAKYIKAHGRRELQRTWREVLTRYYRQIEWDEARSFYKVEGLPVAKCTVANRKPGTG